MSFKKQQPYHPYMFKAQHLPSKSDKLLFYPKVSHNMFYHNVYSKVPEEIFCSLFCVGKGIHNINTYLVVAKRIFKEGGSYSNPKMFQIIHFKILILSPVEMMAFKDNVPMEYTFYKFFATICEYKERTGFNLYVKVFRQVTQKHIKEHCIFKLKVYIDNILTGICIGHNSHYHIARATQTKSMKMTGSEESSLSPNPIAVLQKAIPKVKAAYTCFELNAIDMYKCILGLRFLILQILVDTRIANLSNFELQGNVFGEPNYTKAVASQLETLPSKEIASEAYRGRTPFRSPITTKTSRPPCFYRLSTTTTKLTIKSNGIDYLRHFALSFGEHSVRNQNGGPKTIKRHKRRNSTIYCQYRQQESRKSKKVLYRERHSTKRVAIGRTII